MILFLRLGSFIMIFIIDLIPFPYLHVIATLCSRFPPICQYIMCDGPYYTKITRNANEKEVRKRLIHLRLSEVFLSVFYKEGM